MKKIILFLLLSVQLFAQTGKPQPIDNMATPLFKGLILRKQTLITNPSIGIQIGNVGGRIVSKDSLGTLTQYATSTELGTKQNQLNGTGFVKASGTTISYDNTTYLSTSSAASTYLPISNPTATGTLTAPTIANALGANLATISGNVGIGTTVPSEKFQVDVPNIANTKLLKFSTNNNANNYGDISVQSGELRYSSPFGIGIAPNNTVSTFFATSGNVGIGTGASTPQKRLHIKGTEVGISTYQQILESPQSGYGAGLSFQSPIGGSGVLTEMARITADGESVWNETLSTQNAGLRFFTMNQGVFSEKARILANGNTGFGTTSPQSNLHINNSAGNTDIRLTSAGATNFRILNAQIESYIGNESNHSLFFRTNSTNRAVFTAGGNFLLNTTTDTGERLQVNGNSKTLGNATFGTNSWLNILDSGGGNGRFIANATATFDFGGAFLFRNVTGSAEYVRITATGNFGIGTTTPTSKLQVVGLPVYIDNTAALAGGLTVGAFYRTALGVLMVVF